MKALNRRTWLKTMAPAMLLATVVIALYGPFLGNPFVFDDISFFDVSHPQYLTLSSALSLRWLPYASFEWTRYVTGDALPWLRIGNLCLHAGNGYLLYYFVIRLWQATGIHRNGETQNDRLSANTMAWAAALWFVASPAAVYGAGYLVQRTILMATLFSLAAAVLFLHGLQMQKQRWFAASIVAYFLAVMSKEHAIMVPAVLFSMVALLRTPSWTLARQLAPVFAGYAAVGAFVVYQVSAGHVIAHAYEPNSTAMLEGIDPRNHYLLSVMTQGHLFFQYLWLWLVPDPTWMAADVRADFANRFWMWPQTAGFAVFVTYGFGATALLLRRRRPGLLGFAMLAPWLLFATELATVRIQENFVIYRSYLWMPWLASALPLAFQCVPRRIAAAAIAGALMVLMALSWQRLQTFADPARLWDESLKRAQRSVRPIGLGRIYHNRGVAYLDAQRFDDAIRDFDQGIRYLPTYSALYNDRAVAFLLTQRYVPALRDYDMAIRFNPNYYNPYLGRAKVHEALGHTNEALRDYATACRLGVDEVCAARANQ